MEYDKLPSWKDLPDLELYLDQVLLYVNQVTQLSQATDHKLLTASMINNYVKHGYIDKPIKKKYQKKQVARLIAISILKNVFPIQDISQVLTSLQATSSSEVLYDTLSIIGIMALPNQRLKLLAMLVKPSRIINTQ